MNKKLNDRFALRPLYREIGMQQQLQQSISASTPADNDPIKLIGKIDAKIDAMKDDKIQIDANLKILTDNVTNASSDVKKALLDITTLTTKYQSSATDITELQQKLQSQVISGKADPKTLGDIVIKSEAYAQFAKGGASKFRIEANTITGTDGTDTPSDTLVQRQRLQGIIPGAFRNLRIQDILPEIQVNSNAFEYTRELAFTNNAAETKEGASKPQTDLTFELLTAPIRTIAHWIKVSTQILDDAPALKAYIDSRMTYGVELRLEQQLINGNGTGQNISGMLDTGNFTPFTPTVGDNALDTINRIIEAVELADYPVTGVLMHTSDWHEIERLKVGGDAGTDERYVVGNPLGIISRVLWGIPVIVTNSMVQGTVLAANFELAYMHLTRKGTVVEMFTQDDVNVQKNLVTVRGERRDGLASTRPASARAGDLVGESA
jgi:HK97 family phage major capsid protein